MNEQRDCGCWFTTNGYGKNKHPSGFTCVFCVGSGKVSTDGAMTSVGARRETTRLAVMEPGLTEREYNCAYLQHLPQLIGLMGTERALLHLVVKLSVGREEAIGSAVKHSVRACPNINLHLDGDVERNRLRELLTGILTDARSVTARGVEGCDQAGFIYGLIDDLSKELGE